jgi:hypothetical protein
MVFKILAHLLPPDDPRYIKWKNSLSKRPKPWNKGKTKYTNISVLKISQTFKEKKINNFKSWRQNAIENGILKLPKASLTKNSDLAYLIGLVLGDGHIQVFPRTERLTVTLNVKYPKLIEYAKEVFQKVFEKQPSISIQRKSNAVKVSLYQKHISKRIGIISGNKRKDVIGVPDWIVNNKKFTTSCLKGLFEAEGSLCIHKPTGTYNFAFSNKNIKLLNDVYQALIALGYHPERRTTAIRLRKKLEVNTFKTLIKFRE